MTAMTVLPITVTSMEALERLYDEPFGPSWSRKPTASPGRIARSSKRRRSLRWRRAAPTGSTAAARRRAGLRAGRRREDAVIPDRRGNNRIDTLRNIIHDPRVAHVPDSGCGETIRVNGRATISTDPALTQSSSSTARRRAR
jgi:hypothetical protein